MGGYVVFLVEAADFQIDADDFAADVIEVAAGALAELGEAQVSELAQLKAGSDQDRIHVDAALAFEFEEHGDDAGVIGSSAQHPSTAAEDGAGQGQNDARGLFEGGGSHLHGPR